VEAHANACAACAVDLEELRDTIAALRRLPAPDPPPYLAARVMARIREAEEHAPGWREWLGRLTSPVVAAPLAAFATAAMVLSFAGPPRPTEGEGAPPQLAAAGRPEAARGLPMVQQPVGPVRAENVVVASGVPYGRQMARRLRGAGHPHSQSLAAHFDRPAEAVVVSWQGR
jgi:anti-sigma factor RsiW